VNASPGPGNQKQPGLGGAGDTVSLWCCFLFARRLLTAGSLSSNPLLSKTSILPSVLGRKAGLLADAGGRKKGTRLGQAFSHYSRCDLPFGISGSARTAGLFAGEAGWLLRYILSGRISGGWLILRRDMTPSRIILAADAKNLQRYHHGRRHGQRNT
jgi:hypothetical protein